DTDGATGGGVVAGGDHAGHGHQALRSPNSSHVSVAVLTRVAPEYWARHFNPGVPLTVVVPGVTASTVICPAPIWANVICAPTGKATDALVGTLSVTPEAFDTVTNLLLSVSTSV